MSRHSFKTGQALDHSATAVNNAFVSKMEGLRFKSRVGEIGLNVANGSPPLQNFFERSFVARRRNDAELGSANLLGPSAQYTEYNVRFDFDLISND